jgi:hypothetical protein
VRPPQALPCSPGVARPPEAAASGGGAASGPSWASSRSGDEVPACNSQCGRLGATWTLPRASDEARVGIGEAPAASARSCCAGEADAEHTVDVDAAGAEHDGPQEAQRATMQSTSTTSTSTMRRPRSRMGARAPPARAIDRLVRSGMPFVPVGDVGRFDVTACRAWLAEHGRRAAAAPPLPPASVAQARDGGVRRLSRAK